MTSTTQHSIRDEQFGEQLVGATFGGKYRLDSLLGRGSSGIVFRATHLELESAVAIKVLNPSMMENATAVERFKREARAASRLDHPNAMRALDFGEDARGLLYIVFELIEGSDLFVVLSREGSFSAGRASSIMAQILAAVARAHDLGVIHRDLKPENIMLQLRLLPDGQVEEVVKVCDFGIAQLSPLGLAGGVRVPPQLTNTGLLVGTPHYMSPEQARAEPIDGRTDIYSAGVLLFQLLTGRLPFENDSPLAVAVMQCSSPVPRPSMFAPVSPRLEAVCLKAMSKLPEHRYQDAEQMRRALLSAAASGPASQAEAAGVRHESSGAFLRSARETEADQFATLPTADGPELYAVPRQRLPRRAWIAVALLACAVSAVWALKRAPERSAHAAIATAVPSAPAVQTAEPVPSQAAPAPAAEAVSREAPEVGDRSNEFLPVLPAAAARGRHGLPPPAPSRESRARTPAQTALRDQMRMEIAALVPESAPDVTDVTESSANERVEPAADAPDRDTNLAASVAAPSRGEEPAEAAELLSAPLPSAPGRTPEPSAIAATRTTPMTPAMTAPGALREPVVTLSVVSTTAGISKASVRNALSHQAIARCYKDAARAGALSGSLVHLKLEITTDDAGRVSAAALRGDAVPDPLRRCIEAAARSARVREVDTGRASATLDLSLSSAE